MKEENCYQFEASSFRNLEQMAETLLLEVERQVKLIDYGQVENCVKVRKYILKRLACLQNHFQETTPLKFRYQYNTLYSKLYRLEHEQNYRHPYLESLMQRIISTNRD